MGSKEVRRGIPKPDLKQLWWEKVGFFRITASLKLLDS